MKETIVLLLLSLHFVFVATQSYTDADQFLDYIELEETVPESTIAEVPRDPQDSFFRYLHSPNIPGSLDTVPKPLDDNALNRNRRNADYNASLKIAQQIQSDVAKRLGKPLEVITLEPDNTTRNDSTELSEELPAMNYTNAAEDILVLNDFIRFKRDSSMKTEEEEEDEKTDANREPRGAMKEQWIKQPYPVEDTSAPAQEKAPRVHFVTHRLAESAAQTPYVYSYNRMPRMRDFTRDAAADSQDFVNMRSNYYDETPRHHYRRKYEPYYHEEETRDRYYPRYESSYDRYSSGPDRNDHYSYNRQRRIIYYATLPEVVRSPPHADLRGRFPYRNVYDDRHTSTPDLYHYKPKSTRYEDEKVPYPLKVSTDVNVSEIKKNPVRRIYSETDRRYPFKMPNFEADNDNAYKRM